MPKRDKYHPDYKKLYPDTEITPEVAELLKRSDRKMEYMEVDLKQGAFRQDAAAKTAVFIPSREDSLERIQEEEKAEFTSTAPSPEEIAIHKDEVERLHAALDTLTPEERSLIRSIFFDGISEETAARRAGITQQGISWRIKQILAKLKKFL